MTPAEIRRAAIEECLARLREMRRKELPVASCDAWEANAGRRARNIFIDVVIRRCESLLSDQPHAPPAEDGAMAIVMGLATADPINHENGKCYFCGAIAVYQLGRSANCHHKTQCLHDRARKLVEEEK